MHKSISSGCLISATAAALVACGGGGGSDSAPDTGPEFGQVYLGVSDAPVQDARQVCVEFSEAEFQKAGSGSQVVTFDPPQRVDLLAYQGMNVAPLLVGESLEAGAYQWVRLGVNSERDGNGGAGAGSDDTECVGEGTYIVTAEGAVHNLYIPSGAESGLKMNRGFTLAAGGIADFVAEFDLLRSVRAPRGLAPDYIMRPVVHLHDKLESGSIAGTVAAELASAPECLPAVYAFSAGDVPDDNEDDAVADSVDPVAGAIVVMNDSDGTYSYEVGPLVTGDYDVAFSCDDDDPEADDVMEYVLSPDNPVTVEASSQAIANF